MTDRELDELLKSAAAGEPHVAVDFQRGVWARIAAQEQDGRRHRFAAAMEWFFGLLVRPPVAVSACAVMLLAGAGAGLLSARGEPAAEAAYLQAISPFHKSHR